MLTGLLARIVKITKMTVLEAPVLMEVLVLTRLGGTSASVLLGKLAFFATWKMSV